MSDTATSGGSLPFASIFSDPLTQGLLGMTAAAGQMAMPTRMPVPFGAVLGAMAGGFGQGAQNAYRTQLEQAQAQQEQLKNQLVQSQLPLQQAQNQWMLNMYQHPEVLQKLFSQGGQAAPNAPALPGQTPSTAPASGQPPIVQRDKSLTAGMQANNPGNLMYAGQPGVTGVIPLSGGRALAAFPDMASGVAANAQQLMINQDQHGANTVRQQVTRWVNDPKADLTSYVNDTAKALGVDPDSPVNWHDPTVQSAFIQAQFPHESAGGSTSLNQADVLKGVQMATAPRGQQYAQAGNVATDAATGAPAAVPSGPAAAQAPAAAGGGVSPGDALNTALQLESRAQRAQAFSLLPAQWQQMMVMSGYKPEDATLLRQEALQYRELANAGPKARAEALAKGQVTPQIDRFGNMYVVDANGTPKYLGRGNEVKIVTDPNHPGRLIYGNVGGEGVGAQPPPGGFAQPQEAPNIPEAAAKEGIKLQAEHGIMPTVPGAPGQVPQAPGGNQPMGVGQPAPAAPQSQEIGPGVTLNRTPGGGAIITDTRPQQAAQFHADSKQMEDESESLLSAQQAQMRNQKMRDMAAAIPQSGTAGDQRLAMSTFIKTFFPDKAGEWLTKTANLPDANLGAEFQKLALTSAGSQENAQQGARGGYRLLEMYKKANPGMNLPQNANVEMANLITTANQMDIDYLNGEHQFFQQRATPYLAGQKGYSEPIANYDTQWMAQKNPQVYLGAVYAMSGRPFAEWSKGLQAPEIGRVLDVVKRIDPTSQIMWQDGKPHVFAQAQQ